MRSQQLRITDWVKRQLSNTGILARELLGYNYDEDEGGRHVNVGKGGIVDYGKTEEIIKLLDDRELQYKLVKSPRESRKSTILQCFCVRQGLLNPNVRICYIGRTMDIVRPKSIAIRAQFERAEITDLFGPQKGEKWEESEWTLSSRTNFGLQNATFTAFAMDNFPTGGRFDIVILDDFIDDTNVSTAEQNQKTIEKFAKLMPFIARGGQLIVVGTTWADDDLYSLLEGNPLFAPPTGGQVICGAGVRVITTAEGKLDLELAEGGLTFPHLTLDYLRQKLHGMALKGQVDHFSRQYNNENTSRSSSQFKRQYFRSLEWADDMQSLSGYLLTDTAVSQEDTGCYSVLAYVGLDAADNIYVLDLLVGHWEQHEFVNLFFFMLEKWQKRVNHCGEAWEAAALATAFRDSIDQDSRSRRIRTKPIEMPRPPKSKKSGRILRLQSPMANKKFWIVNTVPMTFDDLDGTKELWNPAGFFDGKTQTTQPSGELVDEFIKPTSKKDIPDTLAMILEWQKIRGGHRRFCSYRPWKPKEPVHSLTDHRMADYIRAEQQSLVQKDWWDTLHDRGI